MKEIRGDLIQYAENGLFDVIIHGCNCQCQMGKGIALTIKRKYPQVYEEDCKTEKGDRKKIGTYSSIEITNENNAFTVINGYTQFHWRGTGVKVDYNAIRSIMAQIKINFTGKRIGYPLIGVGLAGGDWSVIAKIIDEEEHTLVRFDGEN